MTDNDYNKQIIAKVRRNIEKRNHSDAQNKEDKEYVGYINLPYIAGTSEILRPENGVLLPVTMSLDLGSQKSYTTQPVVNRLKV